MRNSENQAIHEDSRGGSEHVTNVIPHNELARRSGHNSELPHTELTGLSGQAPYALNFSFEELNTIGLDEAPPRHSNLSWQVLTEEMYFVYWMCSILLCLITGQVTNLSSQYRSHLSS